MTAKYKRYYAYTLVEMLVVMAIFIIISIIGFSSFYGFRDAIAMNEETLTLEQDIRYAQRAALFLERKNTDRWLYGIGIDFSKVESAGTYNIFKWCSQFDEYGDDRTKSAFPNYLSSQTLGALNGNLPVSASYGSDQCPKGSAVSQLSRIDDTGDMVLSSNFSIDLPASNDAVGDVATGNPVYILFESVSGRAFFYDATGVLINFDQNGNVIASPVNFVLDVLSDRTKTRKSIVVSNISGKVEIVTTKTN